MFKENHSHLQQNIFGFKNRLSKKKLQKLYHTQEYYFYHLIYCNIKEKDFEILYRDCPSRPNAPINALVSAIVLMQRKNWSYNEFFSNLDFDLRTRTALGLSDLEETPFCRATLFNFQKKIAMHFNKTGEMLLERALDHLSEIQIKELKIKTDIQRTDSFLAGSNIQSYSRVQLLVEVLIRLYRILREEDKKSFTSILSQYTKYTSENFVYKLRGSSITHVLDELAQVYHALYEGLRDDYRESQIFQIFERVYLEHFTATENNISVIPSSDLHSGVLQSPDDIDATYRKKRDIESRGQTINVTETGNPDNGLQLITDVAIAKNNVDDSDILHDRLDNMKSKTPDLNEMHTDGGYGSEKNDRKMEELGIAHIQTAIKGRDPAVEIVTECDGNGYYASCPFQRVIATPIKKRFKAVFDINICRNCVNSAICPLLKGKGHSTYYFDRKKVLADKRKLAITKIPKHRRKIRANVESTVKEMQGGMKNKKLKVRRYFRTAMYAYSMAISINFGRIYRYRRGSGRYTQLNFSFLLWLMKQFFQLEMKVFAIRSFSMP